MAAIDEVAPLGIHGHPAAEDGGLRDVVVVAAQIRGPAMALRALDLELATIAAAGHVVADSFAALQPVVHCRVAAFRLEEGIACDQSTNGIGPACVQDPACLERLRSHAPKDPAVGHFDASSELGTTLTGMRGGMLQPNVL